MPARSATRRSVSSPAKAPAVPKWLRATVVALAGLMLLAYFSTAAGDSDTWWHLKTGQYIVGQHRLPVPDPFAYTTYTGKPVYAGEETTRYFNLTHEWLAQCLMWLCYAGAGLPGLVLLRAAALTVFCGWAGWLAYGRTRDVGRAVGASIAAAAVMYIFSADRPQYFTYVFLGLTLALLESRRRLWLLPPLFLLWANCHGGFVLGWAVAGAYCAESLYQRFRGKPAADERTLWASSLCAILISGLNPNYFRVLQVLQYYRKSPVQTAIWEWQHPKYWELTPFTLLLFGALAVLLWNRRKTRPVDWLLLAIFGFASLSAVRNIFMMALVGSFLVAVYLPEWTGKGWRDWLLPAILAVGVALFSLRGIPAAGVVAIAAVAYLLWRRNVPVVAEGALAVLLASGTLFLLSTGAAFQLHAADWKLPEGAADFLLQHHIKGRIFNTYGQGGYLLWRLWPEQQVFVDGRALNETVIADSKRIAGNADETGGKSGEELLKQYGIDVIVMDSFESISGQPYYLAAALADPVQKEWKLVYRDVLDVIYMRNPPPDVRPLDSLDALVAMEEQCGLFMSHGMAACARGVAEVFVRVGDNNRARKWADAFNQSHYQDMFMRVK